MKFLDGLKSMYRTGMEERFPEKELDTNTVVMFAECPRCNSTDIKRGDGCSWYGETSPKVPGGVVYCSDYVYSGLESEFTK